MKFEKTNIKNPKLQTIETITPEIKEIIKNFKTHFSQDLKLFPELNTSWLILRFLRARQFDLKKSYAMFQNFIEFRKRKNLSKVKKIKFPEKLLKEYYIRGFYNTDKNGWPIIIERVGFSKTSKIFELMTNENLENFFIQLYEKLIYIKFPICSKLKKKRIDRIFVIIDLKNVNFFKIFSNKMRNFLKRTTKVAQLYYPELLGRMYIINAGWLFKGIWNVIKLWLDKFTKERVKIFSNGAEKEISEFVEKNRLPRFLGGECQEELYDNPGPWRDEVLLAEKEGRFLMRHRDLEFFYFLTEEEKIERNFGQKKEIDKNNFEMDFYSQESTEERNSGKSRIDYQDIILQSDREIRIVKKLTESDFKIKF